MVSHLILTHPTLMLCQKYPPNDEIYIYKFASSSGSVTYLQIENK